MFSVTVTVPAVPAKTAKPAPQAVLGVPAAVVQLVAALSQLAVPPSMAALGAVLGPSQNWVWRPTTRCTWPGVVVRTEKSAGSDPAGTAPMFRPLSVRAPP